MQQLFAAALAAVPLKRIKCIDELGLFRVIDGSLFPTLRQMRWTAYRQTKNACKLHLSFDLNRLIPTEFVVGSGKSSERAFLESVLEEGVTYIADRGYGSFAVVAKILQAGAHCIFRVKQNLLYEVAQVLPVSGPVPSCMRQVRDELIVFTNDPQQQAVRLIQFAVQGSKFRLLTNRVDVSTLQVITLYAYRWQIELFFKYVKRTLKGLHLFNHSENGVAIQFYVLLTLTLLLLAWKQQNPPLGGQKKPPAHDKEEKKAVGAAEWIRNISKVFYEGWKISKQWLLVVRNSLAKPVDNELLTLLECC